MLELYEHNQNAYQAAKDLMIHSGKAAVIHPTGTGKSIIAFKLVEDHSNKRICWLSPSIYIVNTQRENVCRLDPNFSDDNVFYCTYTRLMNMDLSELQAIQPDYIILDEFHRCGASEWGKGVQALLRMYPETPILGLSATNIRYLDNQRDMADELFDGNVASEMTIAEAIVAGILPAPIYVTAMYSYQNELERLERRVRSIRHHSNYDANKRYLDALRRALEQSLGLEQIFEKYIRDRSGKYIVFCSGKEHLNTIREQIPEWFAEVDGNPHIYRVLSEDLESEKEFAVFKQDDSAHLKLLLCIDMLSEGIHVEDISGVILLRPTVSPIVYKQQIGRALSAGKHGTPLIFDVVNNFDNLYNISDLQEEISEAIIIYRERNGGDPVLDEAFRIYDEVRECRELFAKLEESLSVTWDINYLAAKDYYKTYGNLNIPAAYRTEDQIHLGGWIAYQRRLYHGNHHGTLTPERIEKLNQIGMIWENRYESTWEKFFSAAEEYYIEHGNLNVQSNYATDTGLLLGRWVCRQSANREKLTQDKIDRLNAIGMTWRSQWEKRYDIALRFLLDNPDYKLSQTTVIEDFWVGKWLVQQLRAYEKGTLTPEQCEYMEAMIRQTGLFLESRSQQQWKAQYDNAKRFMDRYGTWDVSPDSEEDRKACRWIRRQLRRVVAGEASPKEAQQLKEIGIEPKQEPEQSPWMKHYIAGQRYWNEHGNLNVSANYVTDDGVRLGAWVVRQRGLRRSNELSQEQIELLDKIGIQWDPWKEAFNRGLRALTRYYEVYGDINVPGCYVDDEGYPLYQWMIDVRKRKAGLTPEEVSELDQVGFEWRSAAQIRIDDARIGIQQYLDAGGRLDIPRSYRTEEGLPIG